jgi:hypothetical protein
MVADEDGLGCAHAATLEGSGEDPRIRLLNAFDLGDQNRVE